MSTMRPGRVLTVKGKIGRLSCGIAANLTTVAAKTAAAQMKIQKRIGKAIGSNDLLGTGSKTEAATGAMLKKIITGKRPRRADF